MLKIFEMFSKLETGQYKVILLFWRKSNFTPEFSTLDYDYFWFLSYGH